jgi:DNA-binding LytR/AlgR family response regulator
MTSAALPARYRFGAFELQLDERRLLSDGTAVSLRPRAFDLLAAFVDRAGGRGSGPARAGVGPAQDSRQRSDRHRLRAELREILAAVWPELEICTEAEDGIKAMHAMTRHAPDVLFLDIEMLGMSGLEVAQQASGKCHVVFVTAYDKYAVTAFEQGAVGLCDEANFQVHAGRDRRHPVAHQKANQRADRRLDPKVFWQIHRSTVVNVNAIAGVSRDLRGHLHVKLKQRKEALAVSESYVHLFKQM